MPKRSIQDLQPESEPAAKRVANQNENEIDIVAEQKLQAARMALDRLDYKNAQNICTELIDSNYSDPSAPLILRSLALEKQDYLDSSVEDAEGALELKESKKTHLRCSLAYLAHALHHLECAREQPEHEQEEELPISEIEIDNFCDQVYRFKSLEAGNPFKKRVSEDLFLHMASFFDSPSLAIFSATSKKMRSSIHASTGLFRAFKMAGQGENLTAGINYFSQRCGNSIRSIDIEVKEKLSSEDQRLLESAISSSSSTLQAISISHQGDLCKLIIQIASLSPSLKILSSTNPDKDLSPINDQFLEASLSWNLKLTKLVWDGGAESLVCDGTLIKLLQSATEVNVYSKNIRPSWVLDLLRSASSTLVSLNIPMITDEVVDEMSSKIELPKLVDLRLDRLPQSRSAQVSFFDCLRAPNLRTLCLDYVNTSDLFCLPSTNSIRIFTVLDLLKTDGTLASEAGEKAATSFVKAIKDWKELRTLDLRLEGSDLSSFYTHLVDLLTPPQQSEKSGFEKRFLLPKLQSIVLGDSSTTDTPISARRLVTFVETRLASWNGLSSDQKSSVLADDLSQVDQQPQGRALRPDGSYCYPINTLTINSPLEADDETLSWLEKSVPTLKIKHRVV